MVSMVSMVSLDSLVSDVVVVEEVVEEVVKVEVEGGISLTWVIKADLGLGFLALAKGLVR